MTHAIGKTDYLQALRFAKFYVKKFGTEIIDGKDAHDFAIDALMQESDFKKVVIKRRIIDAVRREWGDSRRAKGSRGKRKPTKLPINLFTCDKISNFDECEELFKILKNIGFDQREVEIAKGLIEGRFQQDIASMLKVSPTRINQIVKKMGEKMLKHYGENENATVGQMKLVTLFKSGEKNEKKRFVL